MNTLGFVFSVLMILAFGFAVCLEKQVSAQRLRAAYLGHCHANRKILLQCESEFYNSIPYKRPIVKSAPSQIPSQKKTTLSSPTIKINPHCACLNLFPLIAEGRETHPMLYETAAKLFKLFYGDALFENKPHAEVHFLNAFLKAVKIALEKQTPFVLEKIQFKDPLHQKLYYKMLKGTKDPLQGYPSLLEYIKIDSLPSKICLFHAHPIMISVLFSPKVSLKIYQALHQHKAPPMTQEIIERLCSEAHTLIYNTDIFDLIELRKPRHKKELRKILVGEDTETHISLKKSVILNG